MTRHVHKDVASVVGQQALASGRFVADTIRQETNKVLNSDLITTVVDLDVVAVQVDCTVRIAVDGAGERISRVAGHVVGQHEDDLRVGDAKALHRSVHGQDIGEMTVIEPEARCADQDGPVARVFGD